MSTTDQQWREDLRRMFVNRGWGARTAAVIAKYVGTDPEHATKRLAQTKGRAPQASARASSALSITLDRACSMFGLPPSAAASFRAAGIATADAAAPTLRDYFRASARTTPADALEKLKFHLMTSTIWRTRC